MTARNKKAFQLQIKHPPAFPGEQVHGEGCGLGGPQVSKFERFCIGHVGTPVNRQTDRHN